jgi:hypothetical protein
MVAYLFITFAVFWILKFLWLWIDVTDNAEWIRFVITPIVAALTLIPWNQGWIHWYSPFAIAAFVYFLQRLEDLLMVKADEALIAVMKARASATRRPR